MEPLIPKTAIPLKPAYQKYSMEGEGAFAYQVTTEVPSERNFLLLLNRPMVPMPPRAGGSVQESYLEQLRELMRKRSEDAASGETVALCVREIDPVSGKTRSSSVGQLRAAVGTCAGEVLIVPLERSGSAGD